MSEALKSALISKVSAEFEVASIREFVHHNIAIKGEGLENEEDTQHSVMKRA